MIDVLLIAVAVLVGLFLLTALRGAPYVPSRSRDLERAFDELYKLAADDLLVDIGSGDGRVLMMAVKRGARAVGFEINPVLAKVSNNDQIRTH